MLKHFELLSSSYVMLKQKISADEIEFVEKTLIKFADQFENIYGCEAVTMNIHLLRHYGENIKQSGPAWCHSMFTFEKNIGIPSITVCQKEALPTNATLIQYK